jgi:hypothetical protein
MAFETSILYSDGLSISQNHYNNGTTAYTNLFGSITTAEHLNEEYKLSIEARFEDFLLAQARSNAPKNVMRRAMNSADQLKKRYQKLWKKSQCHIKTIATLKLKNEALKDKSTDNLKKANAEIKRLTQQLAKRPREPEVIEYQQPAPKKFKYGEENRYKDGKHECDECEGLPDQSRCECAQDRGVAWLKSFNTSSDDY